MCPDVLVSIITFEISDCYWCPRCHRRCTRICLPWIHQVDIDWFVPRKYRPTVGCSVVLLCLEQHVSVMFRMKCLGLGFLDEMKMFIWHFLLLRFKEEQSQILYRVIELLLKNVLDDKSVFWVGLFS